jgi:hypothetical protein
MRSEIKTMVAGMRLRPGASRESVEAVTRDLRIPLPDDYLELIGFSNGMTGDLGPGDQSFIIMWPIEKILQLTLEYGINDDCPELLAFGKDAAVFAYAFDTRKRPMPVIQIDLIDHEYRAEVASDFVGFLNWLASQVEDI